MKKKRRPKIGLALGGGAAKGFAHIGVIKILEKNNIPIDFIAGCSIGAMVGGYYAKEGDIKKVEKVAQDVTSKKMLSLIDPVFRHGLIGGDKVTTFIKDFLGEMDLEDCAIPFSVVATDVETGDPVILQRGNMAEAIRASISYPLVFKPVELNGKFLVDGGLSIPVPVKIVKEMGADIVIAVNLDSYYFDDMHASRFGFLKVANNSINLLCHHLANFNAKEADVVISPRIANVSWSKFSDGGDLISIGEKEAENILPEIKKIIKKKEKEMDAGRIRRVWRKLFN